MDKRGTPADTTEVVVGAALALEQELLTPAVHSVHGTLTSVGATLAEHLVHAHVRRFATADLDAAIAWAGTP